MTKLLAVVFLTGGAFYEGSWFGRYLTLNYLLFEYPLPANVVASLRELFWLDRSYSQGTYAQDKWIARSLMPGKRDGFYVDVGSADGTSLSNTKLLDEIGWRGVCIEPFPTHMEDRTCQLYRQPVFSESGKRVRFRTGGIIGGIDESLGKHRAQAAAFPTVEFVTATLDEILAKAKAPRRIDYMSLDIEGAELEALRGLSFEKYEVSAFTIETNGEIEKREGIRHFLEGKGYVRVRSWGVDDWYVRPELAQRYRFAFERWPKRF